MKSLPTGVGTGVGSMPGTDPTEAAAIVGGLGRFRGTPVCVIGQEKGATTDSRIKHNFGMARPEGYRKAVRLMEMADRFGIPVLSIVDSAGAYPGIGAEERGQAEAIARSTDACLSLGVPNIAIVTGEGMSGGAIAIAALWAIVGLGLGYMTPTVVFDTFGIVDAATHGGPGKDTAILVYKVYFDGFKGLDLGGSAAQSVVLMTIVVALLASPEGEAAFAEAVRVGAVGILVGERLRITAGVPFLAARRAGVTADAGVEIDHQPELPGSLLRQRRHATVSSSVLAASGGLVGSKRGEVSWASSGAAFSMLTRRSYHAAWPVMGSLLEKR